jgi:hypothetical protein
MTFSVTVRIGFVNGSCIDGVQFAVSATDEEDVKRQVTSEYIMTHVSDDWGMPIAYVSITKLAKAERGAS